MCPLTRGANYEVDANNIPILQVKKWLYSDSSNVTPGVSEDSSWN